MPPNPASSITAPNSLPPSLALANLPTELHIHLFKLLDIVTATCLGLTKKHLYSIFKDVYGHMIPVKLYSQVEVKDEATVAYYWLSDLLERWMLPRVYAGQWGIGKFVSWERLGELIEMERGARGCIEFLL